MKVLYFGSLREQLDLAEESLDISDGTHTVATVMDLLRARGDDWSSLLSADGTVLVAVNHRMGMWETPVTDTDEMALFPPVTGG